MNRRLLIAQAVRHLQKSDPVMGRLIEQVGPFTLRLERDRFHLLVRSIISQQLSTTVARTIRNRLERLLAPDAVSPASLIRLSERELRSVGLSRQKAAYLSDLARKASDGTIRLQRIGRLDDERVIRTLTQVKGIGRWTAQMFLIFSLGRLDVFPHDDLGLRVAIRDLYRLGDLPDKKLSLAVAAPWRPYASVASWYCWRSLDVKRRVATYAAGYPS